MSRPKRDLPSTPRPGGSVPEGEDVLEGVLIPAAGQHAAAAAAEPGSAAEDGDTPEPRRTKQPRPDPAYLIRGTGCRHGHEPGLERDAGPLGELPTARATWIGLGLLLWGFLGLGLLVDRRWFDVVLIGMPLWLAFSAFVQRRAGHRGRCWRTRTWRHAWGGLSPIKD